MARVCQRCRRYSAGLDQESRDRRAGPADVRRQSRLTSPLVSPGRPDCVFARRQWHLVRAVAGRGASPDHQGRKECGPVARWTTSCFRESRRDFHCGDRRVRHTGCGRSPRSLNPYYGDSWPTFSPDGKSIAVFLAEEGRYGDYWILPLNGDAPRRVTWDFQEGGAPAWTPDGKSLLIRSSRAGSANLWRVSVADGTLERLTSGAGDDFDPAVSPDGRTVLFANVKRTWEVIVQDLHSGKRRTVLARRTLLVFPRFSPDGRRIALAGRNSRGETHLFVMDADGSNLTAVTDGAGELNIMPQWGGDGDTLYFYQVRPTQTFRRVSVSGGASREDCAVVLPDTNIRQRWIVASAWPSIRP